MRPATSKPRPFFSNTTLGALHPLDIEDLVRIYIRAVQCVRFDPRFAEKGDMADFWDEFTSTGHA